MKECCGKKSIKKRIAIGALVFPWSFFVVPFAMYGQKVLDFVAHIFGGCLGH